MNFLNHIFKKHKASVLGILSVFVVMTIYLASTSFATGPFTAGTELDPNCEPGDPGCVVTAGGAGTLEDTLDAGNTTGANDILIDSGHQIYSETGDIQSVSIYDSGSSIFISGVLDVLTGASAVLVGSINPQSNPELALQLTDDSGNNAIIDMFQDAITIFGTKPGFQGMKYNDDYSADYTNRSLVDKEYTDSKRPYEVYVALLSQSGTDAPVATILENTLGATPTFLYAGTGIYGITVAANFWVGDKTFILSSQTKLGYDIAFDRYENGDDEFIIITTTESSTNTLSNDVLINTPIEIRIYP